MTNHLLEPALAVAKAADDLLGDILKRHPETIHANGIKCPFMAALRVTVDEFNVAKEREDNGNEKQTG